jgi:putative pantetheine hydrolase
MRPAMATTIGLIATDATLTKAQCQKVAGMGHDGMARAINPVHTLFDGDTLFAMATGARPEPDLTELFLLMMAAGDCVTRAIAHGLLAAESVHATDSGGVAIRSWRDAFPSALR